MKKILTGIGLIIIAILLAMILLPIGFVYGNIMMCIKSVGDYKTYQYYYRIAQSIDVVGNSVCRYLFNDCLIHENGYPFGSSQETISSVLGKNIEKGTLNETGKALNWWLNKIEKNHSLISIQKNVTNE